MIKPCTVDASVFLNAFFPSEAGHQDSHRFLQVIQEKGAPVVVPFLLLPEIAGTISRIQGNSSLARDFAASLKRLPGLVFISLDGALAQIAADIAADHRLRGSDSVYAAVALRFGATLVTLDREQLRRLDGIVPCRQPSTWNREQGRPG
jgi:predicted nucleic acid-binding protein